MKSRQLIEVESGFWTPTKERPFAVSTEKPDRHQAVMNRAYKRWQPGGDLVDKSMEDFFAGLGEPDKMAVEFGKANQQITNGGITQWISNGYADASIGDLQEYCEKYGKEYKYIGAFGRLIDQLIGEFEEANDNRRRSFDTMAEWIDYDPSEDVCSAIQDQDWNTLDDLLGGTDLDARRFKQDQEEILRNNTTVETYSSTGNSRKVRHDDGEEFRRELAGRVTDEPPAQPDTNHERWSFRIVLDDNDHLDPLWDAGEPYDEEDELWFNTEEEAQEAGDNFRLTMDMIGDDGEAAINEIVIEELCREYGKYGKTDRFTINKLTTEFYSYNEGLLADITKFLDDKYPEDVASKAKATLKKAWGAVKGAAASAVKTVTNIPARVKDVGRRVVRAGHAAKQAFSARESLEAVFEEEEISKMKADIESVGNVDADVIADEIYQKALDEHHDWWEEVWAYSNEKPDDAADTIFKKFFQAGYLTGTTDESVKNGVFEHIYAGLT